MLTWRRPKINRKMMANFEIYRIDKSTAFYYRLKSGSNQEIILESEGYATKYAAIEAIESAKIAVRFDRNFESKESIYYTFALKTGNGETVGRSKKYLSATERDNALQMVKKEATNATVEDLTLVSN